MKCSLLLGIRVGLNVLVAILPVAGLAQPWQGQMELRGNYYFERSTRVIAPEVNVTATSPEGTRVRGHYLVDAITSASVAAGARTDNQFTEFRHDIGVGVGHEFEVFGKPLDLALNGRVSWEPDYTSLGASATASLGLNQRSTTLSLGAAFTHDIVGQVFRGLNRADPSGRDLSDRGTVGVLDGMTLGAGISQLLSPQLSVSAGYDLGLMFGYLQNPYRQVPVDGVLLVENHPDFRHRHSAYAEVAYRIIESRTSIQLRYRGYLDSWNVAALEPEVRVYQDLGDHLKLRLRYRFYTQTRAFFQQASYSLSDPFRTADPKMTAFDSHLVGLMVRLHLGFLDDTFLAFAKNGSLELSGDYLTRSNAFGNGVIAQAAVQVPF